MVQVLPVHTMMVYVGNQTRGGTITMKLILITFALALGLVGLGYNIYQIRVEVNKIKYLQASLDSTKGEIRKTNNNIDSVQSDLSDVKTNVEYICSNVHC